MLGAGRAGIPQIVAPGCLDLIDFAAWEEVPERFRDRPCHAHNRLIASAALTPEERRETAREVAARMARSKAPVHFLLPRRGIEEWDREGEAAHDPGGLAAFLDEMRKAIPERVGFSELDCHINDEAFAKAALGVLDGWIAQGTVGTSV